MARTITTSVYCPECCILSDCSISFFGSNFENGVGKDESGPCVDFLTTTTEPAPQTGLYECKGLVDDQGTITWSGGSFFSPANQQNVGPCFGGHEFTFTAFFQQGQTVSCEAGSWGDFIGCEMLCCLIPAP
jgi:hypothetical protein